MSNFLTVLCAAITFLASLGYVLFSLIHTVLPGDSFIFNVIQYTFLFYTALAILVGNFIVFICLAGNNDLDQDTRWIKDLRRDGGTICNWLMCNAYGLHHYHKIEDYHSEITDDRYSDRICIHCHKTHLKASKRKDLDSKYKGIDYDKKVNEAKEYFYNKLPRKYQERYFVEKL